MPNHCSNALIVTGPDAAKFFTDISAGTDNNFIETLIPMPEGLSGISSGACTIDGDRVSEWRDGPDGKPVKITEIDRAHLLDLHGTLGQLDWARTHWGTKWGAYDVSIEPDVDRILFDSAWSPPQAAIDTISTLYPNARFELAFAEGGSCFYGKVIFENGALIESEEYTDFWDDMASADDDPMDAVLPEVREHIEEYGLHTGG